MLRVATLVLLLWCVSCISLSPLPQRIFNVMAYGAINDGSRDNTDAFVAAWRDACKYEGKGRVVIPRGVYALGSVTLIEGYCKGFMSFLIYGTLRAPVESQFYFTNTWIGFRYVEHLTVKGGGYLDGQGHVAWQYNDCSINSNCKPLPLQ